MEARGESRLSALFSEPTLCKKSATVRVLTHAELKKKHGNSGPHDPFWETILGNFILQFVTPLINCAHSPP
jgi:hypothetical protein